MGLTQFNIVLIDFEKCKLTTFDKRQEDSKGAIAT